MIAAGGYDPLMTWQLVGGWFMIIISRTPMWMHPHPSENFMTTKKLLIPTDSAEANKGAGAGCISRLVCAQHGRDVNGVQVPCRKTRHENEETTI
jgi:hypothetical protein